MRNRPDPSDPKTISDLAALRATGLTAMRTRAAAGNKRAITFLKDRERTRLSASKRSKD